MDSETKFREFYNSLKKESKGKAKTMADKWVELKLQD